MTTIARISAKPVVSLHAGDNRASLAALPENSIDAVVTDPPYSLTSITKRFGKPGAAAARTEGNDGSFARVSAGFMGLQWDATGIERDPEFWAAVYRVLKPGGFVFAFSGARTGHWQACAMETAGFIMHPMHAWIYSTGFPKGHDASKAIDRHLGTSDLREVVGTRYEARRFAPGATVVQEGGYRKREVEDGNEQTFAATDEIGGSPEARQWDGWKYGTQTQKPAMEPIYLGQKPYEGKPVESILKWGVGAFNIDGCRVPTVDDLNGGAYAKQGGRRESASLRAGGGMNVPGKTVGAEFVQPAGRYPANLLHDGSPEVAALFPDSKGQQGDVRGTEASRTGDKNANCYGEFGCVPAARRNDSGSAARFFNSFPDDDWCLDCGQHLASEPCPELEADELLAERNAEIDYRGHSDIAIPVAFYHTKAGKSDRAGSRHPTVKPIGLLRHLIRHICPPGGTVLDPFAGSGTTAEAARLEGMSCVLMEAEPEYLAFLRQRFGLAAPLAAADDFSDLLGPSPWNIDDLL